MAFFLKRITPQKQNANTHTHTHQTGKWYHIKGTHDVIDINTCGTGTLIDSFIGVFLNCETDVAGYLFNDVTHDDDSCGARRSRVKFHGDKDTDYYIVVGSKKQADGSFPEGKVEVQFTNTTPPESYECAKATEINTLPAVAEGSTVASEKVPNTCHGMNLSGMWYHLKGTGKVITAHTCNAATDFDTVIDVFTSCGNETTDCLASNDDACGVRSVVTWQSVKDQDYYIFVTGCSNDRGSFVLSVMERDYSEHGYCTSAIEIPSLPFVYRGSTEHLPPTNNTCQSGSERNGMWFHIHGLTEDLIAMTCQNNTGPVAGTVVDVFTDCNAETKSGNTCYQHNDGYCGANSAVILSKEKQDYYIFVNAFATSFDGVNFTLTVQHYRNQGNDRCWQATEIKQLPTDFSGNINSYKHTSTESCGSSSQQRHGAWFSFTNKEKEPRLISATTCNSENVVNADIEVYHECGGYKCVAQGQYNETANCTTVSFLAEKDMLLTIFVTPTNGSKAEYFHVDFYDSQGNANAQCSGAVEVKSLPYYMTGYTTTSNLSYSSCEGQQRQGMWYSVMGTGKKIFATTVDPSTAFDTVLELYSGCPTEENKTCLAVNDDANAYGFGSKLEWHSEAGKQYWIFVRGFVDNAGLFALHIIEVVDPVNSACMNATELVAGTPYLGYTTFASPSNASCESGSRRGLWYKIKTDKTRYVTLETCDKATLFETEVEVYLSCSEHGGEQCVNHEHGRKCAPGTSLTFVGTENKEFYVFVTGARTDLDTSGLFRLTANLGRTITPGSSQSEPKKGGLSTVEIVLIILAIVWLLAMAFGIACWCYRRRNSAQYTRMEVPDGLVTDQQSAGYVPPEKDEEADVGADADAPAPVVAESEVQEP